MIMNHRIYVFSSIVFGFVVISISLAMLSVFPSDAELREGFKTPIIAFEFAQSNSDLSFLSGDTESSLKNRQAMQDGHRWDMVFPFAYAGYLLILLLIARQDGYRFASLGIPFAVLIVPFDLNENFRLLDILHALELGDVNDKLFLTLFVATWLKWGAITIAICILGSIYLTQRNYFRAAIGICTFVTAAAAFISNSTPLLVEFMGAMVALFLLVSFFSQIYTAYKPEYDTNSY